MDYNKFVPNSVEQYMGLKDDWTDGNGKGLPYNYQIEYGKKRKFVEELGQLLCKHRVYGVESMDYFLDYPNGREFVRINYNGGGHHYCNVYGDSPFGILCDLMKVMK